MTYSVAHVLTGHFTIIVARIVTMILAENYEKLSKFVKVTAKILSVLFFRTQCIITDHTHSSSAPVNIAKT